MSSERRLNLVYSTYKGGIILRKFVSVEMCGERMIYHSPRLGETCVRYVEVFRVLERPPPDFFLPPRPLRRPLRLCRHASQYHSPCGGTCRPTHIRWNYQGAFSDADGNALLDESYPFGLAAGVVASDHLAVAHAIAHTVRLAIVSLALAFARRCCRTLVLVARDGGPDEGARHWHSRSFELAGRPLAHTVQRVSKRMRQGRMCGGGGWWVDEWLVRLVDRRRGMVLVVLRGTRAFVGSVPVPVAGVGTLTRVGGGQRLTVGWQVRRHRDEGLCG